MKVLGTAYLLLLFESFLEFHEKKTFSALLAVQCVPKIVGIFSRGYNGYNALSALI